MNVAVIYCQDINSDQCTKTYIRKLNTRIQQLEQLDKQYNRCKAANKNELAWIGTDKHGDVYHFSQLDGWEIIAVAFDPDEETDE